MPFQQLGLPSSLVKNVLALGYTIPTPIQSQAIPAIRAGRDIIGTAQTGTGKTAAFLLPVMEKLIANRKGVGAVILTPTRELAQQIHTVFRGLAPGTSLRSALVVGGAPIPPQIRAVRDGVDLIVATPGRLAALLAERAFNIPTVQFFILDEADQMFDFGFFPDVKRILSCLPGKKQTLLFSATMSPEIAKLGKSILHDPVTIAVGEQGRVAVTVSHAAYPVPSQRKTALLEHLLGQIDNPSVLVFTRTRRGAKRLARSLFESGHGVAELHSDRTQSQREKAMKGFRDRAFPVLVATNIAARGIDVRHITHVINFDVPDAPEEYVHRIGRTGRGGDEGDSLVFVSPEEIGQLARIERQMGKPIPRVKLADFDYGPQNAPPRSTKPKAYRRPAATATIPTAPSRRRRFN